jgi:hypothetical protein
MIARVTSAILYLKSQTPMERTMNPEMKLLQAHERLAIAYLCVNAVQAGYSVHRVCDEEGCTNVRTSDIGEMVNLAIATEFSTIQFRRSGDARWIDFCLIFGNSLEELIADHTDNADAQAIYERTLAAIAKIPRELESVMQEPTNEQYRKAAREIVLEGG